MAILAGCLVVAVSVALCSEGLNEEGCAKALPSGHGLGRLDTVASETASARMGRCVAYLAPPYQWLWWSRGTGPPEILFPPVSSNNGVQLSCGL